MLIYHEVAPKDAGKVLHEGILLGSHGEKTDGLIRQTDEYLDNKVPRSLLLYDISRRSCIYGYLSSEGSVMDIVDGDTKTLSQLYAQNHQVIMALQVIDTACYISDLDAYDRVLSALKENENEETLGALAQTYWSSVLPATQRASCQIARPEILITLDITPDAVTRAYPDR